MTIGQRLKERREAQDLTLDMLQETTKIQKRYLLAIEEENFHLLPGKFYAKAFIKEYANAIGMDAFKLLDEFENNSNETETEQATEYTRIKRSSSEGSQSRDTGSLLPKITVFLLIVAIIIAAFYFYQKTTSDSGGEEIKNENSNEVIRTPNDDVDPKEPIEDVEKPDKESNKNVKKDEDKKKSNKKQNDKKDDENEISYNVVDKNTKGTPESTIQAENVGEKVKIKVSTTESESWLTIKESNNATPIFSNNITSDEDPKEFELENVDELYFIIGNAAVLDIEINGATIEYPVDRKQNVFQKIKLVIK